MAKVIVSGKEPNRTCPQWRYLVHRGRYKAPSLKFEFRRKEPNAPVHPHKPELRNPESEGSCILRFRHCGKGLSMQERLDRRNAEMNSLLHALTGPEVQTLNQLLDKIRKLD